MQIRQGSGTESTRQYWGRVAAVFVELKSDLVPWRMNALNSVSLE